MKTPRLIHRREIETLREMLDYSCNRYSERTAFMQKSGDNFEKISYSRFRVELRALSAALSKRGITDNKISIIGSSGYTWALVYASVVYGGGTIVPLDRDLPTAEIVNLLSQSQTGAVFCEQKRFTEISKALRQTSITVFCPEHDISPLIAEGLTSSSSAEKLPNGEDVAALIFTSGTTGNAKGVVLTHKNLCSNIVAMTKYVDADENDIFLSVLPIHHVYECTCGFLCPLYLGSTIAFCSGLRHIMKEIRETKATIMLGVPLIFENLYYRTLRSIRISGKKARFQAALIINTFTKLFGLDLTEKFFSGIRRRFGNIRLFISGAAAINPDVVRLFCDIGIKLLQGYGLTECSPIVSLTHCEHIKPKSVGFVLPGVQLKIEQPSDGGNGEIFVKGDNVMKEYFHNEAATLDAMHEGWFATGDIGHLDRDGFLYITGRKKNVIINKNGKNVYPEEIEAYLNKSPYIKESLVTGVFDTKDGDVRITAQILPDKESCAELLGSDFDDDELQLLISQEVDKVNDSVQSYKHIVNFKIRKEAFCKASENKIKRFMEKK